LILQLGSILLSVPAWKKAFQLRVLVFVEYESEVEDERGRLAALLEKLRIDAKIVVLWLASGQLRTYESIVNGAALDPDVDKILGDDEWWQELKSLREETAAMSRSQEMTFFGEMLEAGRRRNSLTPSGDDEFGSPRRRRLSFQDFLELPKKPTVSTFAKLGVNFGIHTHNLDPTAFDDSIRKETESSDDDDSETSSSSDADFNDASESRDEDSLERIESPRQHPLLSLSIRRPSQGELWRRRPQLKTDRSRNSAQVATSNSLGYGTINPTPTLATSEQRRITTTSNPTRRAESTTSLLRNQDPPPTAKPPIRPALSRHSSASRFTSNLTPGTTTVDAASGPTIMFSELESSSTHKFERPPLSRASSMARFSTRSIPGSTMVNEDDKVSHLKFSEPETRLQATPTRSRKSSVSPKDSSDVHLDIPELLESYRFGTRADDESRSSYSTQSLPLSFNDLPSRAQHLILNELMRQNSDDTAVLLTTLPIPEEGTCHDEEASSRYLSDIEVLCHELPPTLLVLSNNMTVTVSL
jgi:solute carrier family 12 (potassium/chloride transporters), member 9